MADSNAPPADSIAATAAAPPSQAATAVRSMLRTFLQSACQAFGAAGFALIVVAVVSAQWSWKSTAPGISGVGSTVEIERWIDLSPSSGNCTCVTTHTSYCAEIADAFQASAYLSIAVIVTEGLMALVLCYELGLYGPYGGSHTFTRVHLILALITLGTELLSIFAWWSTFFVQHCGDPSFQETGTATIGWPFFVRCAEAFCMAGYVLYIVGQFSKSNRGPPAMPMLAALFFCAITAVTTFSRGWMTIQTDEYGLFAACTCPSGASRGFCGAGALFWLLGLGGGIVASIAGFVTMFFASLRCVDSEGLTLKFATITSSVSVIGLAITLAGFFVAFSNSSPCDSTLSLQNADYKTGYSSLLVIIALVCQCLFLAINIFYSVKDNYRQEWWLHLKDARTKAHEARENEEGNDDASDDEQSDDDAEDREAEAKQIQPAGENGDAEMAVKDA